MSSRVAVVRVSRWIAYRYTSTPGVKRGTIRNGLREVLVETEHSGIYGGISGVRDQRCSRLLHKKTREPSSSADGDRTVDLHVVA